MEQKDGEWKGGEGDGEDILRHIVHEPTVESRKNEWMEGNMNWVGRGGRRREKGESRGGGDKGGDVQINFEVQS